MLDSQGSRLDFWSVQGVKLKNLMGQDLDPGRGWKYSRLCGVPPLLLVLDTAVTKMQILTLLEVCLDLFNHKNA